MAKNWLKRMMREYDHPAIVLWRSIELKTIDRALRQADIHFRHPILDLGCGEGKIAKVLFGSGVVDYGLDNLEEMVKLAKQSGVYKNVLLGDACQLPFKNNTLRVIFSNCVIEHIPDIDRVISEVSRVLKKDGLFIVTVPSSDFSRYLSFSRVFSMLGLNFLARQYSLYRNKKLNHYNCFDLPVWADKLKRNNLLIKNYQFYISPATLFLWDCCVLFFFPMKIITGIFNFRKIPFPFRNKILGAVFSRYYREEVNDHRGGGLLLVAVKN